MRQADVSRIGRGWRCLRACALGCLLAGVPAVGSAAPPGWTHQVPVAIAERSGTALADFQVRLDIDTAALIAAGSLRADAGDLRFGSDGAGTVLLDHWVESGIGTASTVVWVKVPALAASTLTGLYLFAGNPAATSASTLQTFDYAGPVENSAVNQISGGTVVGFHNSQRGFRFAPTQDLLLLRLGRYEPNGTVRYVTLFDDASQSILAQLQVGGPAAQYSYADLAWPIWLMRGTDYVLQLYQGPTDDYYYRTTPLSMNPLLQYRHTLVCNDCTQNTLPTTVLSGENWGYADFQFRTRRQASPEPAVVIGEAARATYTVLTGDQDGASVGTPIALTAVVHGPFSPGGTVAFFADGKPVPGCGAVGLPAGALPAAVCTTTALSVGAQTITAAYSGDADNFASISDPRAQTVVRRTSATRFFTPCRTTFVEHQPFTMFADVDGYAPGGAVRFAMEGNTLCDAAPLEAGLAACTVGNFAVIGELPYNSHRLGAHYGGDVNNTASVSPTEWVTVLSAVEYLMRGDFEFVPPGCPLQ
jgi:hypothetical protein